MPPESTKKPPVGKGKTPGKGKPSSTAKKPTGGGLNKKVGGLPVWAWGALVLGAVAIGLIYRARKGGATSNVTPADTTGTTADGSGALAGDGSGSNVSDLAGAISDLANQLGAGVVTLPPDGTVPGDGGGDATNGGDGGNPITASPAVPISGGGLPGFTIHLANPPKTTSAPLPAAGRLLQIPVAKAVARSKVFKSKPQAAAINLFHPSAIAPQAVVVAAAAPLRNAPATTVLNPSTAKRGGLDG